MSKKRRNRRVLALAAAIKTIQHNLNESSWKYRRRESYTPRCCYISCNTYPWNQRGTDWPILVQCFLGETWSHREGTERRNSQCLPHRTLVLGSPLMLHPHSPHKVPGPQRQIMGTPSQEGSLACMNECIRFGVAPLLGLKDEIPVLRRRAFLIILHIICLCSPFHKDGWMMITANAYWVSPCARDCAKKSRLSLGITFLNVDTVIISILSVRNLREVKGGQLVSDRAAI